MTKLTTTDAVIVPNGFNMLEIDLHERYLPIFDESSTSLAPVVSEL